MIENTVVEEINGTQFESLLHTTDILFVDFWAPWCAPCKQFTPVYEGVAKLYPKILFSKVNIEQNPDFAETFAIRSIPHLMVFKKGIAIYSESGSMPESALKELAQQALDADVSGILSELNEDHK